MPAGQPAGGQQETIGSLLSKVELRGVGLRGVARDIVAALVLFGSLGLRWDEFGRGVDNASVILSVLVAATALLVPYLAVTGVLPSTWTPANSRLTRMALAIPYLTVALIVILRDLVDSRGIGLSVVVGLAGVLLALMPRAVEVDSPEQSARLAYRWHAVAVGLSLAVPVLAVLGFALWQARLGRTASEDEIAVLLPALWLPIVFGWVAWQLATGHRTGRPVGAMVGISALVAVLAHRWDTGEVPFTVATPTACLLAVFAATAVITSEVADRDPDVRDLEPRDLASRNLASRNLESRDLASRSGGRPVLFLAVGYGLLAIAVGYGVLIVSGAVRLGAVPYERGTQTVNLVLCMIGLCSAIMCRAMLSASPLRARPVVLGTLGGLAFVWIVAYSVFTHLGALANPTATAVEFTLPIAVIMVLFLAPSVREYLDPARPATSSPQVDPGS